MTVFITSNNPTNGIPLPSTGLSIRTILITRTDELPDCFSQTGSSTFSARFRLRRPKKSQTGGGSFRNYLNTENPFLPIAIARN